MKNILITVISIFLFISCNDNNKIDTNMTKKEIKALAIEIQKEFSHLNMKMGDISEEKLEQMNNEISELNTEIKELREQLPKDKITKELLEKSNHLYHELLTIYENAGFDTKKINKKIDKMEKALENLE